jgi:prepilin-type N-terminal cleavage/methylation domain-containing protein/prepilin-type processing-associated H-X9-DG protein
MSGCPALARVASRRGFTLIEVSVVVGVVAVLMAITIPAVQSARATARSTDCKNRLKQFGLLWQEFDDLKQSPLLTGDWAGTGGLQWDCPSDITGERTIGRNYVQILSGTAESYAELISENNGFFPWPGSFRASGMKHCMDGASRTIAMSEILDDGINKGFGSSGVEINLPIRSWHTGSPFRMEVGLASYHSGGVNVVFVDGHVEFIDEAIDSVTWSALGTRNFGDRIKSW